MKIETREAAFMGRITASVAHEMKNVLAIIKESTGLMEDILSLGEGDPAAHKEKFSRVISNIGQQVGRGVDLATRLNRFAHCPDEIVSSVDLNQVVDQIVVLSRRFAKSKQVSLEADLKEKSVILVTDPFRVHMLLFNCISVLLDLAQAGTQLNVVPVQPDHETAKVIFSSEVADRKGKRFFGDPAGWEEWSGLVRAAQDLKAVIEPGDASVVLEIVFRKDPR